MHDFQGDWTGVISGTNNADVFVEMSQSGTDLSGKARINDKIFGTSLYYFTGNVNGIQVLIEMKPEVKQKTSSAAVYVNNSPVTIQIPVTNLGDVTAQGTIKDQTISGKWTSTIGTGGTFHISRFVLDKQMREEPPRQIEDTLFVMMSISSENPEIEDVLSAIKRASKGYGIDCTRIDEVEHSGKLTDLILDHIDKSRYLICDVTTERPNVYYELGYAHGRGKEVILIARQGSIVHFDIKDYNIIFYRNFTELEERIAKRIAAIKEKD
jgi:hypothetical protein